MTTKRGRAHAAPAFEGVAWRKSSYSGGSEGQCFEYAGITRPRPAIAVRDSKNPGGPVLVFSPQAFSSFLAVLGGEAVARS
ncbi:DUF397 domain-containing protein [Streptomyces sp. NPDC059740]|uniref:DUF397 domain-containing protein n=1 Tax=Streptomyces sp. NPDC059740 TaxID=3346926 RepID=UPI003646C5D9